MVLLRLAVLALIVTAAPASALKPPREELPAPRELLAALGAGSSDAEIAAVAAAAAAHPLGTIENPVRVGGPDGERAYIARLRCDDGTIPQVGAKSQAGVGAYGTVVNAHPLDCGANPPGQMRLVTDIYHEGHVEERAPAGFSLVPR